MKTVLIETVENGFIVRPFNPGPNWYGVDHATVWVYSTPEELQAALPGLLTYEPVCQAKQ